MQLSRKLDVAMVHWPLHLQSEAFTPTARFIHFVQITKTLKKKDSIPVAVSITQNLRKWI